MKTITTLVHSSHHNSKRLRASEMQVEEYEDQIAPSPQ